MKVVRHQDVVSVLLEAVNFELRRLYGRSE
jgi:hypothetical protein